MLLRRLVVKQLLRRRKQNVLLTAGNNWRTTWGKRTPNYWRTSITFQGKIIHKRKQMINFNKEKKFGIKPWRSQSHTGGRGGRQNVFSHIHWRTRWWFPRGCSPDWRLSVRTWLSENITDEFDSKQTTILFTSFAPVMPPAHCELRTRWRHSCVALLPPDTEVQQTRSVSVKWEFHPCSC